MTKIFPESHNGPVDVEIELDGSLYLDEESQKALAYDETIEALGGKRSELSVFVDSWDEKPIESLLVLAPRAAPLILLSVTCIKHVFDDFVSIERSVLDLENQIVITKAMFALREVALKAMSDKELVEIFKSTVNYENQATTNSISCRYLLKAAEHALVFAHSLLIDIVSIKHNMFNLVVSLDYVASAAGSLRTGSTNWTVERDKERLWQIHRIAEIVHAVQLGYPVPGLELRHE